MRSEICEQYSDLSTYAPPAVMCWMKNDAKIEPERIHTMIPGMLILRHMVQGFGAGRVIVSQYGVREGYLCQKILKAS